MTKPNGPVAEAENKKYKTGDYLAQYWRNTKTKYWSWLKILQVFYSEITGQQMNLMPRNLHPNPDGFKVWGLKKCTLTRKTHFVAERCWKHVKKKKKLQDPIKQEWEQIVLTSKLEDGTMKNFCAWQHAHNITNPFMTWVMLPWGVLWCQQTAEFTH